MKDQLVYTTYMYNTKTSYRTSNRLITRSPDSNKTWYVASSFCSSIIVFFVIEMKKKTSICLQAVIFIIHALNISDKGIQLLKGNDLNSMNPNTNCLKGILIYQILSYPGFSQFDILMIQILENVTNTGDT